MIDRALLARVAELAADHLDSMDDRHAGPIAGFDELRTALGGPLPEDGVEPSQVVEELARGAAPGLVASPGPRYFGFVTGGALPAALAADWLASAWDQNSFSAVSSPAASVVEEIACGWLLDVLGLPADCGVGLTTGAQMANVTGLAAARHTLLARAGWDVEEQGLGGAPPLRVFAGAEAHVTVWRALRLLGIGRAQVEVVPADDQGAMRADALHLDGPAIVCAQAGNVNSGRDRPARRDHRSGARARRVGPRRRRLRPVGGGEPGARPPHRGHRPTPTRGRPTGTSGSTCRTTAASSPSATAPPTPRR